MRILLITDNYLPHVGGSRVYYHNLYSRLSKDSFVLLTTKMNGYEEFDARQDFPIYRIGIPSFMQNIPIAGAFLTIFTFFFYALYLVIRYRITIIHCGEPEPSGVAGLVISAFARIPYIAYVHDDPDIPGLRIYPKYVRYFYNKADGIVAACSQARENVLKYGIDAEKVLIIRTALESSLLEQVDGKKIRDQHSLSGALILLTVGRLVPEKGHENVIRLLSHILRVFPNVYYVIAGEGYYENKLRELVFQNNVVNNVIFTGYVSKSDLPCYYAACDIFIMLNHSKEGVSREGLGMVFLEASAQGKPVVGSLSGGTADAIINGITGWRLSLEKTDDILAVLCRLLADENERKMFGDNGREYVKKHFSDWQSRSDALWYFSESMNCKRYRSKNECTIETQDTCIIHNR